MTPPARHRDQTPPTGQFFPVLAVLLTVLLFTVIVVRLSREISLPVRSTESRMPSSGVPVSTTDGTATVVRIVDGDTVHVRLEATGEEAVVRLVGVDTPETLKPNWPVECWGPEASEWIRLHAEGKPATLRRDPFSDDRDKYGRLVRYITVEGESTSLNYQIVETGNGRAYTNYPFTERRNFVAAEKSARGAARGLWGPPCGGSLLRQPEA